MFAKPIALALLSALVACGGARFSADTPVTPLTARTSAYLEGGSADPTPSRMPREALRDDVDLISAKDRSLCFRATVRQGEPDDVTSSQWELEVNDQPVALGKELVSVRDYSVQGETVRALGLPADEVSHLTMPALAPKSYRVYERQLAFCRGFAEGIPEDVELELTLKRSHAHDSSEEFKWRLHAMN